MINPNKSPYHGQLIAVIVMLLPSPIITWMLYVLLNEFQPQYTAELNLTSATVIGFGIGSIYHMCCWITGAFTDHFGVVKNRVKEFFADLTVSLKLALTWYFKDIKTNGLAFWIDFAVVTLNFGIFIDALIDYFILRGVI